MLRDSWVWFTLDGVNHICVPRVMRGIGETGVQLTTLEATEGSAAQMRETLLGCHDYGLVVWQKHGVVARSDTSALRAALIEYAEMASRYEVLNLQLGTPAAGLTDDELRAVCRQFVVPMPGFLGGTVPAAMENEGD